MTRKKKSVSSVALARQPRGAEVRQRGAIDYITDPDHRGIEAVWRECGYEALGVKLSTFEAWARTDAWAPRRQSWSRQIEERILTRVADQAIADRWSEYQRIRDALSYAAEYIEPLRDERGQVMRHPFTYDDGTPHPMAGKPMFGLAMGKMHEHTKMVVDLIKTSAMLRGDVTQRSEHITRDATRVEGEEPGTVGVTATREELHSIAKALIEAKDPRFKEAVIDIPQEGSYAEEEEA